MATTSQSMKFHKSPYETQTNPNNLMNTNPENNASTPNLNFTMHNTNNHRMHYSQQLPFNPNLNSQEKFYNNYNNIYTNNTNAIYFNFKERSGKLKWKEIMRLDLDNMIRANDISSLENYLENLIFSDVNENDMEIITESTTVKLIKIYQHILEYLLHTQIRLENENKMLETNYSSVLSDSIMKESTLKENKSMITTLKKDKREKEMILNTYKCIIDEYKSTNFSQSQSNNNNTLRNNNATRRNPNKVSKSMAPADVGEKKYFFCNFCSGKKFSTEEFLQSHISRRHANINNNTNNLGNTIGNTNRTDLDISDLRQSKREYVKNLENQVDELKGLFKSFMVQNNNINIESLNKLADNQKVLENKIVEVKSDKEKLLNVMEENFKTTLMEIKDFVKNNQQTSSNNISQENFNNLKSPEKEKENKEIKDISNNINNINSIIVEIKNNQNKKIDNVYEEIKNFKSSISTEIRDLKINNNNNNNNNNQSVNQNFQSFADVKNYRLQTESVEIPKNINNNSNNINQQENTNNNNALTYRNNNDNNNNNNVKYLQNNSNQIDSKIQQQNKPMKNVKSFKPHFNAGTLESDYSEEEGIVECGPNMMKMSGGFNKKEYMDREKKRSNKNSKEKWNKKSPKKLQAGEAEHLSNEPEMNMQEEEMLMQQKTINLLNDQKNLKEKKGNIFDKEKLRDLQDKENEEQGIEDNEKLAEMDVSNFTKEKNEIKKSKEVKSNKKNDEHEIILDNASNLNTQNSKQNQRNLNTAENINNKKEDNKSEIKEVSVNENKSNQEINFKKRTEEENKSQVSRKTKSVAIPNENEIKINDLKNETSAKIEVREENVENVRVKIMDQFTLRQEMFKNSDFNYKNVDLESNEALDGYKRVLEKPNGNKQKKLANDALETKLNDHIKLISGNETKNNINYKNIGQKKPEELIGLIDNILNYVNTQKEKSNGFDVENDDEESEVSCEVLFGKFYYDLNNTIFKKICLEDEFNFMINEVQGIAKNPNVSNQFREAMNLPKPVKDGNKFINKMEEKNLNPNAKLIESKEMNEKIKSFNKETESAEIKLSTGNNKFNNDDEFNH